MKIFFRSVFIVCSSVWPLLSFSQSVSNSQWKGLIHYDSVEVPFVFLLTNTSDTSAIVTIINATENIIIKNVVIKNDSIIIPMYVFDSEIKAVINKDRMTGEWHKNYQHSKGPEFTALLNKPRFVEIVPPTYKVAPIWDITFTQPTGKTSKAIGQFTQNGGKITGTIRTEVGDLRYFEGITFSDSIKLSSFDGVHGFLMLGKFKNGNWHGVFHYKNGYSEKWTATSNPKATLINPFKLITVTTQTYTPYYDILTAGGQYNAINPDSLEGKVVIIQLMGTWCPNSLDQTKYLTQWYDLQDKKKVALIAIVYEPGDKNYAQNRIDYYSSLLDITYPMYIGGSMSKGQAALAFPNMGIINAFPTLVIIDKMGYIRYIDSYFNGPATGTYYQEFISEFTKKVKDLINE